MSLLRNIDKYIYWDAKRHMYVPHYWRKQVLPSWLGFDRANTQIAANGLATVNAFGAPTPPISFKQPYDSVEGLDRNLGRPFEIRSIVFEDSTDTTVAANFTILLKESGDARDFMNRPLHIRTFAGTAQQPAVMREPYFMPSQHVLSATYDKVAGGATTMRMFFAGAQYYPWAPGFLKYQQSGQTMDKIIKEWMQRRKYVRPYWLTTDLPVNLLANATADAFLKVGDDGHFEAFTIAVVSTGNFEWALSEPKTQQTIMNGVATLTNALGDATFPTMLPTAYLIPSGYRLRLRITDLSGAPNAIFFTMAGRKLFVPMRDLGDVQQQYAVPTPADSISQIVPQPLVR